MFVPWIYKVVLGSFMFFGTGVGIGSVIFISTESENSNLKTTSSSIEGEMKAEEPLKTENTQGEATESKSSVLEETHSEEEPEKIGVDHKDLVPEQIVAPQEKECRIHKLMSSQGKGSFQKIEKSKLKEEILKEKKGDYQQIEKACKEVGDKDIFVSNKWNTGWKYYKNDQDSSQFKNYLTSLGTK